MRHMSTESKLGVYDGWYRSRDLEGLGDPDEIGKRLRSLGFHTYDDAIRGSLEVGKLADLVILMPI